MAGTDVSQIDTSSSRDHTYYGYSCSGSVASTVSCNSNTVLSSDNENQKIGSYYNYPAVTSGSGAAITIENANSPDTFCPLGWQIPYGGTGGDYYNKSRSWVFLANAYSLTVNDQASAKKLLSYPMSYILAGAYYWQDGVVGGLNENGVYYSSTVTSQYTAAWLYTYKTRIGGFSGGGGKNRGGTLRCDFDISNLESSPWHPRSLISIMAFHFLKAHFPSAKIKSNRMPAKKPSSLLQTS